MSFSGTVRIGDLDDFIGPGLECTKPVDIQKPKRGQVGRVKRNKGKIIVFPPTLKILPVYNKA